MPKITSSGKFGLYSNEDWNEGLDDIEIDLAPVFKEVERIINKHIDCSVYFPILDDFDTPKPLTISVVVNGPANEYDGRIFSFDLVELWEATLKEISSKNGLIDGEEVKVGRSIRDALRSLADKIDKYIK